MNDGFWAAVREFDEHLDDGCAAAYHEQPLAQDWARVSKVAEELGEAIAELILYTGQNPRKPQDDDAGARLRLELADVALTAIYCLQHFTKSEGASQAILEARLLHHGERVGLR